MVGGRFPRRIIRNIPLQGDGKARSPELGWGELDQRGHIRSLRGHSRSFRGSKGSRLRHRYDLTDLLEGVIEDSGEYFILGGRLTDHRDLHQR